MRIISGNPDSNSSGISPQEQRLLKMEWTHLPRLQMSLVRQDYKMEWNNVENTIENIKSILHLARVITVFLATDMYVLALNHHVKYILYCRTVKRV